MSKRKPTGSSATSVTVPCGEQKKGIAPNNEDSFHGI